MSITLNNLTERIKSCDNKANYLLTEVEEMKIKNENIDRWYRSRIYEMQMQLTKHVELIKKLEDKVENLENNSVNNNNVENNNVNNNNVNNNNVNRYNSTSDPDANLIRQYITGI